MTLRAALVLVAVSLASVDAAAVDEAKAVASFKHIVEKGGGAGKAEAISIFENKRTSKWGKSRNEIRAVSYDVKKTDSLVSPLTGVVTFEFASESATADTKEAAEALAPDALTQVGMIRKATLRYAYQDDRWVLKTIAYRSLLRMPNETRYKDTLNEDVKVPVEELKPNTAFERTLLGFRP